MDEKRYLSPAEVARVLDISGSTVLRLIHDGKLPAVRVSERIYRIPTPAFERFQRGETPPAIEVAERRVDPALRRDAVRPPRAVTSPLQSQRSL